MKSAIYFHSDDGGDLKACVAGTDKVKFTLKQTIAPGIDGKNYGTKATTGISGNNCTGKWSGLIQFGPLVMYKENFNTVNHSVTVYD